MIYDVSSPLFGSFLSQNPSGSQNSLSLKKMIDDVSSPLFGSFLSQSPSGSQKSVCTLAMSLAVCVLPGDIIIDILSRLPVISIVRSQLVHKSWYKLFRDPNFIGMHFNQTQKTSTEHIIYETTHKVSDRMLLWSGPISKDEHKRPMFKNLPVTFKVEDCSTGLICLRNLKPRPNAADLYFWNPSIRKVKILPHYVRCPRDRLGYGFVPRLNDYKVVKMVFSNIHEDNNDNTVRLAPDVEVFSFRSNSWKRVSNAMQNPCLPLDEIWSFANDSVHWRVLAEMAGTSILAFNLFTEAFRIIRLPSCYGPLFMNFYPKTLCGFLSLVVNAEDHWHVWKMEEYGVAASWSLRYKVSRRPELSIIPSAFTMKGEILVRGGGKFKNSVYVVTVGGLEIMAFRIEGKFSHRRAVLCAETLFLLDGGEDVAEHPDLFGRFK